MAEQLGTVAYKLIEDAVSPANNAAGRRSRIMNKMNKLKAEIHDFHDSLKYWSRRQEGDQAPVVFQDVLADAEKQQLQKDQQVVKHWLVDVKDVYYEVIDVCKELRKEEIQVQEGRNGLPLTCSNPSPQCRKQIRDGIPQMIDRILRKVKDVIDKKGELEKLLVPNVRVLQNPPTASYVHDKKELPEIYFRSKEQRRLITRMYHSLDEVQLISVTGPSGIGKSTLARHVYDEVKGNFNLHAWVDVSEEFNLLRIARDFVVRVTSKKINKTELAMESLSQMVRESIKTKKFLLVLDGLQDVKQFALKWEKLERVFKCDVPGCVMLVTTRQDHDVVKIAQNMPLPNLRDEDCWSIIEHEVFGTGKTTEKYTIEKIHDEVGKKLQHKCQGLPVIAKALGGVLRDRTSPEDWQQVLDSDVWELGPKDKQPAMKATMFSYYFLPPELKQCLLYCSIFPKNHNIDVNQLINLWMAQDSIGLDQEKMEEEGWSRFKKLLDRSIFQDYSLQDDSGSYECKLQGLMSDFIIDHLAENECQIIHLDKAEDTDKQVSKDVRHCTLNVSSQASLPASISDAKKLHTLMVLSEYSSIEPVNLSSLLSKMRRLRALVLSYCSMKELPSKACELWQLRYLDLSFNRDLKKLPLEICNLFNLQTLNLNGCDELQELPKSIGKLTKLRHLDILWTTNLSYLPKGLARLTSLRRLSRFFGTNGADSKACNLEDMKHLEKLHGYISIEGLGNAVSEAKNAGLREKKDLRGMELWFSVVRSKDSNDDHVLEDLGAPSLLECLGIFYYRGSSFPSWIVELEKLKHLILSDCGECGTLPALGRLGCLETLEMKNLAKVDKIGSQFLADVEDSGSETMKGAFPKLQKLSFQKLEKWVTWDNPTAGDPRSHMPLLTSLSIESCPMLEALPHYITRKTGRNIDKPPLQERKIEWPDNKGVQKQ